MTGYAERWSRLLCDGCGHGWQEDGIVECKVCPECKQAYGHARIIFRGVRHSERVQPANQQL